MKEEYTKVSKQAEIARAKKEELVGLISHLIHQKAQAGVDIVDAR